MNSKYLLCILRNPSWICSARFLHFFNNKNGIVIGGHLRWFFKSLLLTPQKIINVDNCPSELANYNVDYVTDAADLYFANDETLDFVCSSHVLEHLTNPLKAIREWKRVIKKGGIIYAGIPDKRHSFDHSRPRTSLSHIIKDFQENIGKSDKMHVAEFLEHYNKTTLCKANKEVKESDINVNSHIHHHVWILDDIREIFEYMNLKIIYGPFLRHGTIHIIGQKFE